jgi:hypothetical protein
MTDTRETSGGLRDWLVPPAWRGLFSELGYRVRQPEAMRLLGGNRELARRHADRGRCFVIGNGPSLKTQDIKPLAGEIVIVANSFFQHPDRGIVAPKYYCVGDTEFIADQPNSVAWLRELEAALPETNLFVLPVGRKTFAKHGLFKRQHVYHVDHIRMARTPGDVNIDFTRPLNVGYSTGTAFSIPLALYLGFREIYLIGFDANWFGDVNHGALHFYETNKYFPHFDHTNSEGHDMEFQLGSCHLEFMSHRLLRDKAALMGSKIVNATNDGWLDMYPRVHYESLF